MLYGMLCNTVRIFMPLLYCYMFASDSHIDIVLEQMITLMKRIKKEVSLQPNRP